MRPRLPSPSGGAEKNSPQISLHSFVLGFILGCIVIYLLYNQLCVGDGCSMFREAVYVKVEALPQVHYIQQQEEGEEEESHDNFENEDIETRPRTYDNVTLESDSIPDPHKHMNFDLSSCPDRPLHLVILVLSSPNGLMRRNAIRGTWLHNYQSGKLSVTARFLIGTYGLERYKLGNLTNEQNQFGDLLLLNNLRDSYSNLSAKVLTGLHWAYETKDFDFLLKTDDDSYVRIAPVVTNLHKMNCEQRLYWGYFMGHAYPEPSGKWAEPNWFHCSHYLPYAMGGGYVLSRRIVNMIMRFPDRLKLYNSEDVTVGSWLAPYDLIRKHDLRFDVESLSHGCNNNYLITHKQRVRSMYEKYTSLLKSKRLCSEEKEIRPGYVYNWTGSPLDCCNRTKGLYVPRLL